jgi:hypothetical protein
MWSLALIVQSLCLVYCPKYRLVCSLVKERKAKNKGKNATFSMRFCIIHKKETIGINHLWDPIDKI